MPKQYSRKWLWLSLVIAIWAGRMLLTNHHFYVHDDIQVFRVNEFLTCFKQGQLPCRWSAGLGKGYGTPWFNYYPPMIYVFPTLIHLLGFSIITSLNLFMFMTFILAAWGMYCLVKEITQRDELAFLGSVLFTLYPFHATNVFIRGVYGENLAWSIAPLILLVIYRQVKSGRFARSLPLLFAFVFLTHIISAFLIMGMAVVWSTFLGPKNWRALLIQLLLGLALAAFFFIPAIAEKNLVQTDTLTQGYYAFTNHFVGISQLFVNYTWNYGASYWETPSVEMGFMIGHVHTILLAGLIICLVLKKSWRQPRPLYLAGFSLIAFVSLIFLAHSKSLFIWQLFPSLAFVQFPWRFIGWAGIPLVLALVLLLTCLPTKLSRAIVLVTTLALLVYSYPFFFPRGYDHYTDADYLSGSLAKNQQTTSLFDYLPVTVHQVPELFASDTDLTLPVFYFPGWVANVPLQAEPVSGLIGPIRHGDQISWLKWQETSFRLTMDLLSLITLCGYGFYLYRSHVQ